MAGHIPGVAAPTSSINCTLSMAIIVFVMIQYTGIKEHHGLSYFKHLLKPFAFVLPLMIMEDLVKPVSLTLRLYGNIYGEETVTECLFDLVPLGVPVIMQALSVLMGLIQALVFALLASIYITRRPVRWKKSTCDRRTVQGYYYQVIKENIFFKSKGDIIMGLIAVATALAIGLATIGARDRTGYRCR